MIDMKKEYGLTNAEIAKKLDELSDDDFFGVMRELAKLHSCGSIKAFGEWLVDVLYEIAFGTGYKNIKYEINSTAEISYLIQFAEGGDFAEPLYREQLRALWTAYCFHRNLTVDTGTYDIELRSVWDSIHQDWAFDDFDDFMCGHLV